MNGIDNIIARIISDGEERRAELKKRHAEKLADLKKETDDAVTALFESAKKSAEAEGNDITLRADGRARTAARDISLGRKSAAIDEAFRRAAAEFEKMDGQAYNAVMIPLLVGAYTELRSEKVRLRLPERAVRDPDALIKGAEKLLADKGIKAEFDDISFDASLRAGFIAASEEIELVCTPEKLMAQKKEELAPEVTRILFG